MLIPLLLILPLGIMGLAMPPKATTTPAAGSGNIEPRAAPPVIEVMTMTCLMPGDDDDGSSSSTSSSSSIDWSTTTDDCYYWGDCSSSSTDWYTTPEPSASTADWCSLFGWDCSDSSSTSASSADWPWETSSSSTTCDPWDDDCSDFATPTPTPTPTAMSSTHHPYFSSSDSSSSSTLRPSHDEPSVAPIPTSLRHLPIPPMNAPEGPRKRGAPPSPGALINFYNKLRGGGSHQNNQNKGVEGVRAVEKISTETIVIGVSSDGAPIWTSTEFATDDSSSSSFFSSSPSSTSFFSANGASSSSSSEQISVTTPAPQFVTVTSSSSSSSSTLRCDDEFCSDGSSWCVYWAGITSWDASKGPVPGEKATTIGTC